MSVKQFDKKHSLPIDAITLLNLVVVLGRAIEKPDLLSKIVVGIDVVWIIYLIISKHSKK